MTRTRSWDHKPQRTLPPSRSSRQGGTGCPRFASITLALGNRSFDPLFFANEIGFWISGHVELPALGQLELGQRTRPGRHIARAPYHKRPVPLDNGGTVVSGDTKVRLSARVYSYLRLVFNTKSQIPMPTTMTRLCLSQRRVLFSDHASFELQRQTVTVLVGVRRSRSTGNDRRMDCNVAGECLIRRNTHTYKKYLHVDLTSKRN